MQLIVGAESTWSMRAWMAAKLVNLSPELVVIPLGADGYQQEMKKHSTTGLVPVLKHDGLQLHDSLAICEYLNELSTGALLPSDMKQRAIARSLCAELHSGFPTLRARCPFSIQPVTQLSDRAPISGELRRMEQIFAAAEGGFMFNQPSLVDVFYAVMAYRMASYGLMLDGKAGEYQQRLCQWPLFQQALEAVRTWGVYGD